LFSIHIFRLDFYHGSPVALLQIPEPLEGNEQCIFHIIGYT